jgi:ketosteroid isomerase-like protein
MYTKTTIFSTALLLALALTGYATLPRSSTDDARAVEQASDQFYKSLNALFTGDASPMVQSWSHADDVTYMGPAGGIRVGWTRVRADWETQAALKLGGKVEPRDVRVTVGGDLAFVQCTEVGENLDAQGKPLHVSIRATNLYRKESGEWKMIGHHTDLLPFLEKLTQ